MMVFLKILAQNLHLEILLILSHLVNPVKNCHLNKFESTRKSTDNSLDFIFYFGRWRQS